MELNLNNEQFGEIINKLLKDNEILMNIVMPKGTLKPTIKDNTGMGAVVNLYIIINALPEVLTELINKLGDTPFVLEEFIDDALEMVKNEVLENIKGGKSDEK